MHCPCAAAGCIPILLEQHTAPGSVLYPLRFLGFEVVQLKTWQQLPEKLLQMGERMARNPQVRNTIIRGYTRVHPLHLIRSGNMFGRANNISGFLRGVGWKVEWEADRCRNG